MNWADSSTGKSWGKWRKEEKGIAVGMVAHVLRLLRQKDHKFEANLGYIVKSCHKTKKKP